VPEKTNEITAIPELLDQPAEAGQLEGALLPIDAIGCPVEMASKIVEHKADFLLPLPYFMAGRYEEALPILNRLALENYSGLPGQCEPGRWPCWAGLAKRKAGFRRAEAATGSDHRGAR
jgi:hypothetical protein